MKLIALAAVATVALTGLAAPVAAQTTVERVHGPAKLLPHHHRKICQTKYVAHRRVTKCYYR